MHESVADLIADVFAAETGLPSDTLSYADLNLINEKFEGMKPAGGWYKSGHTKARRYYFAFRDRENTMRRAVRWFITDVMSMEGRCP